MRGFTLIELLIVMAILAVAAALSVPFIQTFQVSSDLYTNLDTINQTLRRAQYQAMTGQNSAAWGVYFNTAGKNIVLFQGDSYAARDQSYDQATEYADIFSITTDFSDEIYFSLYSGQPSASGTVTIASPNNDSKDITINNFGLIQISN